MWGKMTDEVVPKTMDKPFILTRGFLKESRSQHFAVTHNTVKRRALLKIRSKQILTPTVSYVMVDGPKR